MNYLSAIATFIFGEDTYLGGGRYGPVTQPQLEFVFVRIGAVDVDVDGKHCRLIQRGDIPFHCPT